jgi:hypothetical protein
MRGELRVEIWGGLNRRRKSSGCKRSVKGRLRAVKRG